MAKRRAARKARPAKKPASRKPAPKRPAAAPHGPPPEAIMMQMVGGHWIQRVVTALAALGVADRMKGGPKTADELAKEVGAHGPSLFRLMRAATSAGVFKPADGGRFALTPVGD